MLVNLAYRLLGALFLAFCGTTWAWMLGAFAHLKSVATNANTAHWIAPGILSMPATLSVIVGLVGALFLLGVFPLTQASNKEAQ